MNAEIERRILACPTLPSLPAVVLQILRLCHSDEIDLRKLADTLASDPALTARVLRAANSASVAARGKVATLTRAVPLLGSKAVTAIALSFGLVRCRRRDDGRQAFDRAAFWRRAVFAALAGRTLAEGAASSVDPEEAFIAALLQDLGMLALSEVFSAEYGSLWVTAAGDHQALAALERERWGADHSEVSALLARRWQLPLVLQRAVAASHDGPAAEAPPPEVRLIQCVALSGPLADIWVGPPEQLPSAALETACARLALDPAVLEAAMACMALAIRETSADFDIDLGRPTHVAEVLAEARRLLPALRAIPPAPTHPPVESGETLARSLEFALACARRRGERLSLLLVSCDPSAQEDADARTASMVRRVVRSTDLVGAASRGEVLVLLAGIDLEGALPVARRILERVACDLRLAVNIAVTDYAPDGPREVARTRAALGEAVRCARLRGNGHVIAVEDGGAAHPEHVR